MVSVIFQAAILTAYIIGASRDLVFVIKSMFMAQFKYGKCLHYITWQFCCTLDGSVFASAITVDPVTSFFTFSFFDCVHALSHVHM